MIMFYNRSLFISKSMNLFEIKKLEIERVKKTILVLF